MEHLTTSHNMLCEIYMNSDGKAPSGGWISPRCLHDLTVTGGGDDLRVLKRSTFLLDMNPSPRTSPAASFKWKWQSHVQSKVRGGKTFIYKSSDVYVQNSFTVKHKEDDVTTEPETHWSIINNISMVKSALFLFLFFHWWKNRKSSNKLCHCPR